MGMAASQARYLGLTARKTNVEYEGQQINQARTALANQSANLFNRMLALKTPTAPNKVDYTEQQYAFNDGVNDYEIDSLQRVDKEINGEKYNYLVKYHFNQDVYKGIQEKNSNPQVQRLNSYTTGKGVENCDKVTKNDTDNTYTVKNTMQEETVFKACDQKDLDALRELASKGIISIDDIKEMYKSEQNDGVAYSKKSDLEAVKENQTNDLNYYFAKLDNYSYKVGNSQAERYNPNDITQKTALEQIRYDYPELKNVKDEDLWVYTKNGKTLFATQADLDASMASRIAYEDPYKATPPFEKPITMQGNVPQQAYTQLEIIENNKARKDYQIASKIDYQIGLNQYYAAHFDEKVETTEYARLDDASGSGRYKNIKLLSMSNKFDLKSEEKTNEKNYENAMQQYNYDILKYEKELADINSKTSIIQVQDRTLELRLRQLDTEQKALSTEMESVKSVIQKNIETTFKTFQ